MWRVWAHTCACRFATTVLPKWLQTLSLLSFMNPQTWVPRTSPHVLHESGGWINSFNASISVGNLFERIASLNLAHPAVAQNYVTMLQAILGALSSLQNRMLEHFTTARMLSNNLPMSTVATTMSNAITAMPCLPADAESPFSFHLTLHQVNLTRQTRPRHSFPLLTHGCVCSSSRSASRRPRSPFRRLRLCS